jgi:UDP-hydrolysing UDP-N-acetyl-D-glucosamine 2-epimerase
MSTPRRIVVVTGSRAEFGLLRPVMHAINAHPGLELAVVAAGSHLIQPALTLHDVKAEFNIADSVPMQIAGKTGRYEDAEAVGRGVGRFARVFLTLAPEWVVVLGDRIEAFAAASAASVGGWGLAHIHGGDRAEGVADEAMRHAITKLAHLHLPATSESAQRIVSMGEDPARVHAAGSPAIDGLDAVPLATREMLAPFGIGELPRVLFSMHPIGRDAADEELAAGLALRACAAAVGVQNILALHPNADPGREGVLRAIERSGVRSCAHLPRDVFVGTLKALARNGGLLVGNSSAALIEAAALRVAAVDIGARQAGRERCGNVVHAQETEASLAAAIRAAMGLDLSRLSHPYGDGRAGPRIAEVLAATRAGPLLRKHNTY